MKFACRCCGVDIDAKRLELAHKGVTEAGVGDLVSIYEKDIFNVDVSEGELLMYCETKLFSKHSFNTQNTRRFADCFNRITVFIAVKTRS